MASSCVADLYLNRPFSSTVGEEEGVLSTSLCNS